jgi:hypothetical protein
MPAAMDSLRNVVNARRGRIGLPPVDIDESEKCIEMKIGFIFNQEKDAVELDEVCISCPWTSDEDPEHRRVFAAIRLDENTSDALGEDWWFWSDFLQGHEDDKNFGWAKVSIGMTSGFLPVFENPKSVAPDDFKLADTLFNALGDCVRNFLDNISYLGSMRPLPQRTYVIDQLECGNWQTRGLDAFLTFLSNKPIDPNERVSIQKWLKVLDLAGFIEIGKDAYHTKLATVAQIYIRETSNGTPINIVDMGFGASQVIPVVLQSVLAKSHSLIIIEQPELHLHPRAQAALADLFISVSRRERRSKHATEQSIGLEPEKKPNNEPRFLIETHSEHLLLRLRRRIAESTVGTVPSASEEYLTRDDLTCYFISRDKDVGRSTVEEIQINNLGEMKSPDGFKLFFADDMVESASLASARLIRESSRRRGDDSGG